MTSQRAQSLQTVSRLQQTGLATMKTAVALLTANVIVNNKNTVFAVDAAEPASTTATAAVATPAALGPPPTDFGTFQQLS